MLCAITVFALSILAILIVFLVVLTHIDSNIKETDKRDPPGDVVDFQRFYAKWEDHL